MAKQTKAQIKTAIRNVLDKVAVGSEGGSLSGSLTVEGEGNFVKAPDVIVGESRVTDLLNTKVNLDKNEVVGGRKVFTDKVEIFSNALNITNQNITKGSVPTSNQYQGVTFNAGNGRTVTADVNSGGYDTRMAILEHQTMADGSVDFHMGCYKNVANSRDANLLRVGFDASGAPFASCCTPVASSNSGAIATTQWVNTKLGNYLPLSGGKLTGNVTISNQAWIQSTADTNNYQFKREGHAGGYYMRTFDWASWREVIDNAGSQVIKGMLEIQNTLRLSSSSGNQIQLSHDSKGVIMRNDGSHFYFLVTADNDNWGGYNNLRPLYINLAGGGVAIGHGITMLGGQITKASTSTSWCKGRDTALLRITDGEQYCPILSMKCNTGSWEIGSSGSANGSNLEITFISDANYNSNTNRQTFNHRFDQNGDFIVHRDIRASGGWVYGNSFRVNSDRRLKKDIQDVDYELPNASLKTFKFKNDIKEKTHIGYIAQDIKTQTPQFVDTDENGMLSLDESALLMTAIHEINRLKARIAELEKKL